MPFAFFRLLRYIPIGEPLITIKDIAAKTGFSPTTISLVLNNKSQAKFISEPTKKIVREAAEAMGYRPNIFARSLRAKKSYMVGLVVYDILDPYCTPIVKQIETELLQHSYTLLISDLSYDQTRYREALDVLSWRRVDGMIAIANHFPLKMDALRQAAKHCPVVVIGRTCDTPDLPYFVVGDGEGGYLSARHLLDLGHRRIGFIWDEATYEWSQQRWEGVLKAMKESGLEVTPSHVARVTEKSADAGYAAAKKLLSACADLTALCAVNDLTAFGAIRACIDSGRSVPEDISVIGFDDLALARHYNPPLTTIAQPLTQLGEMAAKALVGKMASPKKRVTSRTLKPALVERRSTRALPPARSNA